MAAALGLLVAAFAAPPGADPVVVLALAGLVLAAALAACVLAGLALATALPAGTLAGTVRERRALVLPSSRPSSRPRPRAPGSGMLAG